LALSQALDDAVIAETGRISAVASTDVLVGGGTVANALSHLYQQTVANRCGGLTSAGIERDEMLRKSGGNKTCFPRVILKLAKTAKRLSKSESTERERAHLDQRA
jgi:hypothetical protein